jgi:hypothetical protein
MAAPPSAAITSATISALLITFDRCRRCLEWTQAHAVVSDCHARRQRPQVRGIVLDCLVWWCEARSRRPDAAGYRGASA